MFLDESVSMGMKTKYKFLNENKDLITRSYNEDRTLVLTEGDKESLDKEIKIFLSDISDFAASSSKKTDDIMRLQKGTMLLDIGMIMLGSVLLYSSIMAVLVIGGIMIVVGLIHSILKDNEYVKDYDNIIKEVRRIDSKLKVYESKTKNTNIELKIASTRADLASIIEEYNTIMGNTRR